MTTYKHTKRTAQGAAVTPAAALSVALKRWRKTEPTRCRIMENRSVWILTRDPERPQDPMWAIVPDLDNVRFGEEMGIVLVGTIDAIEAREWGWKLRTSTSEYTAIVTTLHWEATERDGDTAAVTLLLAYLDALEDDLKLPHETQA